MSTARRETIPIKSLMIKLPNRRVMGGLMADGTIVFKFKRLLPDRTVNGERIRLSQEAIKAMMMLTNSLTGAQ